MLEILYLLPSFIYLVYLMFQEPEEAKAMKILTQMVKVEEARLESLKTRNNLLIQEVTRLEQLAGLLN